MTQIFPNTIEGYLKYCINTFYSELLTKYNFKLVTKQIDGMGGLYQYESDSFSFRVINDRGVVDGTLAPLHNLSVYFDLGLLYGLVNLKLNPTIDKWIKRLALSKNLSCEEGAAFINTNYALLVDLLSKEKYIESQAELEEVGRERADLLFGK
jgi:hypothetical protein